MPKYPQPRKTWECTKDFKVKAVKLSFQENIQVKQVAEGLGIHPVMHHSGKGQPLLKTVIRRMVCSV